MGDVFNLKIVDCHVTCKVAITNFYDGADEQWISCSWESVYDIFDITLCQQKLCSHGESFQQKVFKILKSCKYA